MPVMMTVAVQKAVTDAKDWRNFKVCLRAEEMEAKVLKEGWNAQRYDDLVQNTDTRLIDDTDWNNRWNEDKIAKS